MTSIGVAAALLGLQALAVEASVLQAELRSELEDQFRTSTGLGFQSFTCDIPELLEAPLEFPCRAVDEEGDRFRYIVTLTPEEGATTRTFQPFTQLPRSSRELLAEPCRFFLEQARAGAWDALHGGLSSALGRAIDAGELESRVGRMLADAGTIRSIEPQSYSSPSPGFHQVEFHLDGEKGKLVARFRMKLEDDSRAIIVGFLLTPVVGTALHRRYIAGTIRSALGRMVDQEIDELRVPLGKIRRMGDRAEGEMILKDGTRMALHVMQYGSSHDLDDNDYQINVLDAAFLIRQHLEASGRHITDVACPQAVTPDGGTMICEAELADEEARAFTLKRRGHQHRLVPAED